MQWRRRLSILESRLYQVNIKYSMYVHFDFLLSLQGDDDDDETDAAASMPVDYAEMDIDTIMNGKVWHRNHKNNVTIYHRVPFLG